MKLSCLPVSLYPDLSARRLSLEGWIEMAARLGLDGADLSVAHLYARDPRSLDRLRRTAGDAGVELAMLVTYSDFTHPDAAWRAREVDETRTWIAAAAALGVSLVRVTAGQAHPGVPELSGIGWAVEGFNECAEAAAAAGVRLLYENHKRGSVWQYDDFTHPAPRFLDVVRRTAGTGLGVLFDTANCLAREDDPFAVLERVLDRLGAVHVSDIRSRGAFEPVAIGAGAAPLRPLLERIVAAGFDGWVSIEEASRSGEAGIERAIGVADRLWRDAGGRPRRAA